MLIDYRVCLVKINLKGFHNNVAPSVKVAYEFNLKDPLCNSNSSQADVRNVFHCNGLLLCTTEDKRLVVRNPCSGETKWIQPRDSYKGTDCYALGYDNSSSCKRYKILRYKILRMNRGLNRAVSYKYEIYDFTSDSWRVLGLTDGCLRPGHRGVSVKGNSYWIVPRSDSLLSFDYSTERFQSLSLPYRFPLGSEDLSVVREEQLRMLGTSFNYNAYTVWVTTSPGSAESWRKFLEVRPKPVGDFYCELTFLADEKDEALVYCQYYSKHNNYFNIMGGKKHIKVDPHDRNFEIRPSNQLFLNYVPSFAQIANCNPQSM